ncbi:MAG: dihydrolipoamide acetyltransferase family protein [Oscillochloridaceae bacterium]|nr:2-oxo acid dehydrogenase subunit E2 [Chloroflexaceae bacterium]MDW8390670.1 dihydrolipoamide acetyltransferase family protein [Oscillochloridaceae bacterium]
MIEIKMPQLGESVTEGTIGRWLKRPGETVAKYEPLLEVITDKVDTEVPAPETGTLLEILVGEGETVRVGTVIARIGTPEEAAGLVQPAVPAEQPAPVTAPAPAAAPRPTVAPSTADGTARSGFISPVVARLVAEHGLDLARIPGTGQGGRVTKQDVLRYLEARQAEAPVAAPPAPVAPAAPAPQVVAPPPAPSPVVPQVVAPPPAPPPVAATPLPEDVELVPLTPMRRSIAEHMERSVRTAPHVTTVMEADLSRVAAHREANKAAFERQGVRLTFTPYFVQAAVAGLRQTPVMNGRFTEAGIMLNRRIHIGVAVALDEGLLVPVIRDADEKNLLGLARIINDLAERARTRRLTPDETQGGTFTITNHGVSGSLFATPIINQPQAAILGVGAIVKRPVVVTQHGVDAIAIKPMCYLSLTFDHRVADGATADAFLAAVKAALEGM